MSEAQFVQELPVEEQRTTGDPELLLAVLSFQLGFDFGAYRRTMLLGLVQARMHEDGIYNYDTYLKRLRSDESERRWLRLSLDVPYSRFFRDPLFWVHLADKLAPLVLASARERPLRVWCAGCAGGQEPYTLALLLAERVGGAAMQRVLVFASDENNAAIARARRATYSESDLAALPAGLRDLYFSPDQASFKIDSKLRARVLVMRHDLLRDPLYTKLDVILCRNTLLYFNFDVRRRLLQGFHYALHGGGLLALGSSEMITESDLGFEPVSVEQKTYRRVALEGGAERALHPWLRGGCTPIATFLR